MTLSPLSGAAATTVKVADFNAMVDALNAELAGLAERLAAFEARPAPVSPPDLTTRVEALENLVVRVPAQSPTPMMTEVPPRPEGLRQDRIELVYDKVSFYYGDTVVYADRVAENRWHLYSQLNFIVISPVVWTYDELFEGDPSAVYAHVVERIEELARLKPIHDAVHERVKAMSEGQD